ncbi:MAG: integrase family protein [Burkholderiaceae bacterium]
MESRINLTARRISDARCAAGKPQTFIWDAGAPGLALRVTASDSKAFVFQGKFNGKTVRMTIGSPDVWGIEDARTRARELQSCIDVGRDPRAVKAEAVAADAQKRAQEAGEGITVADAWAVYMAEGKPKRKDAWKPRYVADLHKAAAPGGEKRKRGSGTTKPGHLWPLMSRRLAEIDEDVVRDWYREESKRGAVQAARAVAMLSGFLGWCGTRKEYRAFVNRDCARSAVIADLLPTMRRREDAIEVGQLKDWFAGTGKLGNRTARAYLQALVLTGARREEMARLRWADVDFRWKRIKIADKVADSRLIPLTPYLSHLLEGLPRLKDEAGNENPFVFASAGTKSGHIVEPRSPHAAVLTDAGIAHVSIHGLRRTFALLGEAAGAPAGAIAQIMGHRPSAIAERYKPRSLDALREYAERIEVFVLARAGVAFDPERQTAGPLRVVVSNAP